MRGSSSGLAAYVDAARGTMFAYATSPGSVTANDGSGEHGLYTEELLLRALQQPGLEIEEVFKRARVAVAKRSKGAQTPWESPAGAAGRAELRASVRVHGL